MLKIEIIHKLYNILDYINKFWPKTIMLCYSR
jgi:hypothetical protein